MMPKSYNHTLVSQFDNRNPRDKLADVECGYALSEMSSLSQSLRQMLEDSGMHCEISDYCGRYTITKIIKQRDPCFLTGSERYFIFDSEGKKIPLSEEEFHELLGMKDNNEDVMNLAGDLLESLDSESVPPLDQWDVVTDYTEFARVAPQILENEDLSNSEKREAIEKAADELIYSADWFPYPQDKRLHSEYARKIADIIQQRDLTKQQLGALLGPRDPEQRMETVKKLRVKAAGLPLGPEKAKLLTYAQKVFDQLIADRKARKTYEQSVVDNTDRAKLWAMWREKKIEKEGDIKLLPWQFQKAYSTRLNKMVGAGTITAKEAAVKLSERMEAIYGKGSSTQVTIERTKAPLVAIKKPEWLATIPPVVEESSEDYEFDARGAFPEANEVLDYFQLAEDYDNIFQEETLLEGGVE